MVQAAIRAIRTLRRRRATRTSIIGTLLGAVRVLDGLETVISSVNMVISSLYMEGPPVLGLVTFTVAVVVYMGRFYLVALLYSFVLGTQPIYGRLHLSSRSPTAKIARFIAIGPA